MPAFEDVVRLAQQRSGIVQLQLVVEKELLHHEIIRALAEQGLLRALTFIGGTCLRACYGSSRLSEDLDFTGGADFKAEDLENLGQVVTRSIRSTYGLVVVASPPRREEGNVSTWKLRVQTHPGSKNLPQQRIHIDICATRSQEPRPMVLRNHYGVELGTTGLILQAQTKREILADKVLALALRLNRVKHRDLWDIGWLTQQGETLDADMVLAKCRERDIDPDAYRAELTRRLEELPKLERPFRDEMTRFLPGKVRGTSVDQPGFWRYLTTAITDCAAPVFREQATGPGPFQM